MSERQTPSVAAGWVAGIAVAIISTAAVALILGGGAPTAPPPGIADPGRLFPWLSAVLPALRTATLIATIGFVAVAITATPEQRDELRRGATLSSLAWVVAIALQAVCLAAELHGRAPILGSPQMRGLLMSGGIVGILALVIDRARRFPWIEFVIVIAAIVPTVVVGHARTTGAPLLSSVVLTAHIAAASAWIGGLLVLAWLAVRRRPWWYLHLAGFSRLAATSVVVVAVTGLIAALSRLDTPSQLLTSGYGAIVALKTVLLSGLVGFGQLQRRYVVARRGDSPPTFVLVAGAELTVMAVVIALATALAQTPPPT
ncbi:copper resistance D family protein [Ilumatobacter sp.]|uniref:copper resistance D family protein n=1 Tax=Ilumatobacter sp. TaxID=1967498 RepID=UPI003C6B73CF